MTRVVVVDDDPDILGLYHRMMDGTDLQIVATAEDGEGALDAVETGEPDVVMLDLAMPNADGLEALVAIRRAKPRLPIVIVSGFPEAALGPVAKEFGAVRFIQKGMPPLELMQALREAAAAKVGAPHEVAREKIEAMQKRIRELL